jgi:SAM-dependent methyltransferase
MIALAPDTVPAPNANQVLWEKGDFTRIAATMRESGEAFAATLGVTPGTHVLEVGCGDGTTAIPTARLGAVVRGVDIARNLVAAGACRAREAGLAHCTFEQGDASNLAQVPDGAFDLVVSIFGAMFAPRPFDVAAELVRVARPGGRIVMGNWIPGDPTLVAQILKTSAAYTPPPPDGFVSPMTWGVEAHVMDRFTRAGLRAGQVACERATWTFRFPGAPSAYAALFRDFYGPTINAFDAARAAGRAAALQEELEALFHRQNVSGRDDVTEIPATFLRVTVQR